MKLHVFLFSFFLSRTKLYFGRQHQPKITSHVFQVDTVKMWIASICGALEGTWGLNKKNNNRKSKNISEKPYCEMLPYIDLFFRPLFFFLPRWVPFGAAYDTKTTVVQRNVIKTLPYLLKCLAAEFLEPHFTLIKDTGVLLLVSLMMSYPCSTTARHWTSHPEHWHPGSAAVTRNSSLMHVVLWVTLHVSHKVRKQCALSFPLLFRRF